jgi:hypothetical protein
LEKFPDGYIDKNKLAPQMVHDESYGDKEVRQKAAMRVFKVELLKKNAGWSFNEAEQKIYPGD